ncbi:MAG: hypothetical protein IKC41_05000, partial [Clostridia bacterium]|nr:hypothetical protein [Clostridia bacterium]MBR2973558.1 hypothetical protein [Clostridia bacterium]
MKKLLSMALVLIMVFSLFAVPTMAATSIEVERVINGDFTAYGENHSLTSDTTASSFGVGSGVTATTVNQDGNIVLALAGNKGSDYRSNKFSYAAGDVYKMSADIYLVAPYGTTDGVDYGRVQFQFGSATAAIDLDGDGVATDHAMDWTNRQYAVNGTTTTLGDDYHTWTQSNLPLNTWIHFEATATLNVDVAENGYFKINLMCDSVPATGPVGYVDNISLKYDEAVYDINVTELNDYGTVVAPASVAETGTADIVITPETGYYPYAVTVNGTNVTDDLVASYVDGYNVKEVWTYTLNGSSLSTDTDVQVTYGYYEMTDMFTGGDAEGETQTIIYKGSTTSVQRVSEPNNGGEYAFKIYYEGTAATMATQHIADAKFAWTAGEKYLVSLDVNIPNKTSNTEVELYGSNNYSLMACGKSNANGKKGWTDIGDGWVTLSTYIDGANSRTSDYITVSFYNVTASENMTVAYMDNYSVKKLTKAGAAPITPVEPPAPEVYDVTITAGANANASVSAATSEGEAVNFTVAPKFGYYIQSITIGGTP